MLFHAGVTAHTDYASHRETLDKHRPRLTYNNGSTTLAGDPESAKCIFCGQHEAYPVEILGKTTQYYLTSLPRPPGPEGSRLCLIDQLLLL